MGHATQARAVPVDLASLGVERGRLIHLLLELLGVQATLELLSLGGRRLRLRPGSLLLTDLGGDGVKGGEGGVIGIFFLGVQDRDYKGDQLAKFQRHGPELRLFRTVRASRPGTKKRGVTTYKTAPGQTHC